MGSFRYLLAVLVVASHAHGDIAGYNIGISAVISFFSNQRLRNGDPDRSTLRSAIKGRPFLS